MRLIDYALERPAETGVRSKSLTRVPTVVGRRGIHAKPKYTPAEFFRIYESAGLVDERYQALSALAVANGLREHPLTHFDRRWFDPATGSIHVPAERMKGRGDDYRPLDVPLSSWAASIVKSFVSDDRILVFPNPRTGLSAAKLFGRRNTRDRARRHDEEGELSQLPRHLNSWLANHRCERHPRRCHSSSVRSCSAIGCRAGRGVHPLQRRDSARGLVGHRLHRRSVPRRETTRARWTPAARSTIVHLSGKDSGMKDNWCPVCGHALFGTGCRTKHADGVVETRGEEEFCVVAWMTKMNVAIPRSPRVAPPRSKQ